MGNWCLRVNRGSERDRKMRVPIGVAIALSCFIVTSLANQATPDQYVHWMHLTQAPARLDPAMSGNPNLLIYADEIDLGKLSYLLPGNFTLLADTIRLSEPVSVAPRWAIRMPEELVTPAE